MFNASSRYPEEDFCYVYDYIQFMIVYDYSVNQATKDRHLLDISFLAGPIGPILLYFYVYPTNTSILKAHQSTVPVWNEFSVQSIYN